jgi:hypothetical protein
LFRQCFQLSWNKEFHLKTKEKLMTLFVSRKLKALLKQAISAHLSAVSLSHLARACLNSSIELAGLRKKLWAGDVLTVATRLPFACPPFKLRFSG